MRTKNDKKLAAETTDVDLILGGHDHIFDIMKVRKKFVKTERIKTIGVNFNPGAYEFILG